MKLITCIGCGCDDEHACQVGATSTCSWLRLDRDLQLGVCSACPEHLDRWDDGDFDEEMDAIADHISAQPQEAPALILPGDPDFDARFGSYRRR